MDKTGSGESIYVQKNRHTYSKHIPRSLRAKLYLIGFQPETEDPLENQIHIISYSIQE